MGLPATLKTLDQVEDKLHALYRLDGDLYVLDVDITGHPDISALENAHARSAALLAEKQKAITDMRARVPTGFSVEELERLRKQAAEVDAAGAEAIANQETTTSATLKDMGRTIERQRKFISRKTIDATLRAALTAAGVKGALLNGATALLCENFEVRESGGTFRPYTIKGRVPLEFFVKRWASSPEGKDFIDGPGAAKAQSVDGFFSAVRRLR